MRRLLFVTCEENIDYENDSVFHGLCSLPDTEVSILNETCFDYMFKGFGGGTEHFYINCSFCFSGKNL